MNGGSATVDGLLSDERERTIATRMCRTYSAVFKAKVALAAFAGDTMLADLAQRFLPVEIGAGRAGALVRV